jgi:hypothetical protein
MASLYADASGVILRFLPTREMEARYPTPPGAATATLSFDEATNQALVQDLAASTDSYRLTAGVLSKNGSPVSITAEGPDRQDRAALATIDGELAAYISLSSPTASQTVAVVKLLCRVDRFLIRALPTLER